ncbi:MAG: L-lactate dehydrogenase [Lachnospiraceae bacterium]|nr:L-lactate dehydrogenase [Lachnospiraceae bacterium]
MKVTIIGAGSVGSTIAFTLATTGTSSDIVLIDVNEEKAKGEAMDILQGSPFFGSMSIIAGDYADAKDSDIVIITSGIPRRAGQSRLELAQTNVNIMKDIASKITKYAPKAVYIIVSNPVDVMTYAFHKFSGIPENQIIGSGTILDTSRLRARLAEIYDISQSNVHAYVFGEHGDSSFVTWSLANISNVPIDDYKERIHNSVKEFPKLNREEVEDYVKKSGGIVISRKGATYYAIAVSVAFIVRTIISGMDTTMTVSTMMHGEYGIDDVCLSTLAIVGKNGIVGNVETPLNDEEIALLRKSADNLKEVIRNIDLA